LALSATVSNRIRTSKARKYPQKYTENQHNDLPGVDSQPDYTTMAADKYIVIWTVCGKSSSYLPLVIFPHPSGAASNACRFYCGCMMRILRLQLHANKQRHFLLRHAELLSERIVNCTSIFFQPVEVSSVTPSCCAPELDLAIRCAWTTFRVLS
jgi:hypothetical protein